MEYTIERLKVLIGLQVLDIRTEVSQTFPINAPGTDNFLIETPIVLVFKEYSLEIYNTWIFNSHAQHKLEDIRLCKIQNMEYIDKKLTIEFDNKDLFQIDLSDDGFIGPEALVLNGTNGYTVVWN